MADLTIAQHWADGSCTELQVTTESDYPDALSEGLATILKLWHETCQAHEAEGTG